MSNRSKNLTALFCRFVAAYLSVLVICIAIMHAIGIPVPTFIFAAWFIIGSLVCDFTKVFAPRPDPETATIKDAYKTLWWLSWWPKYLVSHMSR